MFQSSWALVVLSIRMEKTPYPSEGRALDQMIPYDLVQLEDSVLFLNHIPMYSFSN